MQHAPEVGLCPVPQSENMRGGRPWGSIKRFANVVFRAEGVYFRLTTSLHTRSWQVTTGPKTLNHKSGHVEV